MAFCDFVVKYDPSVDKPEELTKRIIYSILIKRLKAKKPAVVFIGGDSGEGKSYSAIRLIEIMLEIQGLDPLKYFNAINVYTPLQYPKKLDKLLFDEELKKVNILCMHEAREVVKAKMWQSFLTQAVSDVNAMSRSIKRLCFIIISQFIRDITNDIRYTLNFYMIVRRPKGKKARLYINVMWKDDRDLEKPKLRKRKLSGYIVSPDGKYRRFVPQYLELSKPRKELIDIFEAEDYKAKAGIIRKKLDTLLQSMKDELGVASEKVDNMVEWYSKDLDNLHVIGKRWRGKWKVKPEVVKIHKLTTEETVKFEQQLNDKLVAKGLLDEPV